MTTNHSTTSTNKDNYSTYNCFGSCFFGSPRDGSSGQKSSNSRDRSSSAATSGYIPHTNCAPAIWTRISGGTDN